MTQTQTVLPAVSAARVKRPGRAVARRAARLLPLVVAAASVALAQTGGTTGEITQQNFTDLATKVLTYLGYAIAAGLTVLIATIAARVGWNFFGKFIGGGSK